MHLLNQASRLYRTFLADEIIESYKKIMFQNKVDHINRMSNQVESFFNINRQQVEKTSLVVAEILDGRNYDPHMVDYE